MSKNIQQQKGKKRKEREYKNPKPISKPKKKKENINHEERSLNSEEEDENKIQYIVKKSGLSRFMIRVYLELKNKSINLTKLSHLVRRNPNIVSLNKNNLQQYLEAYKTDKIKKSKKNTNISKPVTDENLRKFIISEDGEKILKDNEFGFCDYDDDNDNDNDDDDNNNNINNNKEEKKDLITDKDLKLIWKYCAWARTTSGYMVYLYYIGPDNNEEDRIKGLSKLENYQIIQPSHLINFHNRFINHYKYYLTKTSNVKDTPDGNQNPEYDPRFFVYKWQKSYSCTSEIKKLIDEYAHLFKVGESFMLKQIRKNQNTTHSILSNIKLPYNTDMELPPFVNNNNNNKLSELDEIELDRIKQQQNGYMVDYDEFKKIDIDYFPSLSIYPINKDINFNFEKCKKMILNAFIHPNPKIKSPEKFKWNPIDIIISIMFSLHMDKRIIKCISSIFEKENLVIKNGNMKPLIEYIFNHSKCIDEVKLTIEEWIWSNFALELSSRDIPLHLQSKLFNNDNISSNIDFIPL